MQSRLVCETQGWHGEGAPNPLVIVDVDGKNPEFKVSLSSLYIHPGTCQFIRDAEARVHSAFPRHNARHDKTGASCPGFVVFVCFQRTS